MSVVRYVPPEASHVDVGEGEHRAFCACEEVSQRCIFLRQSAGEGGCHRCAICE